MSGPAPLGGQNPRSAYLAQLLAQAQQQPIASPSQLGTGLTAQALMQLAQRRDLARQAQADQGPVSVTPGTPDMGDGSIPAAPTFPAQQQSPLGGLIGLGRKLFGARGG